MSQRTTSARPRRFATACDECSRRKVKCDATEPPCRHCARQGIDCTYTRATPDLHKPRRAARQLKVVNERLRHVQELLAEAQGQIETGPAVEVTQKDNEGYSQHPAAHTEEPRSQDEEVNHDILAQPVSHSTLMVIELFFEQYERFLPIVRKMKFINMVVQPAARSQHDYWPLRVALHAMLSVASGMAVFSTSENARADTDMLAAIHLQAALSHMHHLVMMPPTWLCAQALFLASVACHAAGPTLIQQASVILASAYRATQVLRPGTTTAPDPVEARLPLSMYVVDSSISAQLGTAPIIDGDLSMLNADAHTKRSGTLSTLDQKACIDLLVARVDLARIQNQICSLMLEPEVQSGDCEVDRIESKKIMKSLLSWKSTHLPPREYLQQDLWPDIVYMHVARLVLEYFLTMRRLYPASSNVDELMDQLRSSSGSSSHALKTIRDYVVLPAELVSAGQHALTAVRSVGRAGRRWLEETLPAVLAATTVTYQAVIVDADPATGQQHFERAESWFELLSNVSTEVVLVESATNMNVLGRLRRLAALALEANTPC